MKTKVIKALVLKAITRDCFRDIVRGKVLCWISFSLIYKKESPSESNTIRSRRLVKEDITYIKAFDRCHLKSITKTFTLLKCVTNPLFP